MLFRRCKKLDSCSPTAAPIRIPEVSPNDLRPLLRSRPESLPRIDWSLTNAWIADRGPGYDANDWRRAVISAFLDDIRGVLEIEHVRWRSPGVEGLAPKAGAFAGFIETFAETCIQALRSELRLLLDNTSTPLVAIALVEPIERYIDLTDSYMPEEGQLGSSAGMYINEEPDCVAIIAVHAAARYACQSIVAHEMTHHFLHGLGLPLWAEEGIAQRMEERMTGESKLVLTRELARDLRSQWNETTVAAFLDGSAFISPEGRTQEFAYCLADWLVRREVETNRDAFLKFLHDCRDSDPDAACLRHLGVSTSDLTLRLLRS